MRTVVFVFIALCAASALSLAEDAKKAKPSGTVTPAQVFGSSSASATTPKPTTTTPKPKTTTPKPKTTTPKPTTTTAKPTTPPPKPTTTTPKPKTTTPKPKTTTTPPPPPPPKPTPPANLTGGNYTLMTDKKELCLMAQMAIQIRLATPKANGTFIVQPNLTKAEGSCKDPTANLTLVFKEGFITFMFNKSAADKTVYVNALSFSLSYPFSEGANGQYNAKNVSVHLFTARVGHAYSCKSESLFMGNGLYLDVDQDRMQAFNLTNANFGTYDSCPADQPDYRVAIAVGVTLLVLIVIVVIAYLLGRRRRTDGYQSL